MKFDTKRVIIAGGGTGGHLFPAMAIGETLEKDGMQVKYIGSKNSINNMLKKIADTGLNY